jgi:membrane-associated phospholipid phosphatase
MPDVNQVAESPKAPRAEQDRRKYKQRSPLPVTIPLTAWILTAIAFLAAIIEIQFAEASWHLVYGILSGRLTGILTTANQYPEVLTIGSVCIAVWIYKREFRGTIVPLLVAIGLASLATGIMKDIFGRARPPQGFRLQESRENLEKRAEFIAANPGTILGLESRDYWLITSSPENYFSANRPWFKGDFASFPSGHATSAFAFSLWLVILFPKGRWLWWTLAVLTCLARIRFRRHHPGDVIFGAGVGYIIAYLVFSSPWMTRRGIQVAAWVERRLGG